MDWDLVTIVLQDLDNLFDISLIDVSWGKIELGEDDKHREVKSPRDTDVLLGHLGNAHVSTNSKHAVVWIEGS